MNGRNEGRNGTGMEYLEETPMEWNRMDGNATLNYVRQAERPFGIESSFTGLKR